MRLIAVQLFKAHLICTASPVQPVTFLALEQTPFNQLLQVDQIRVSRKNRIGLVGGISVAYRPHRKNLPPAQSRLMAKVGKPPGMVSQRPHSVPTGKAGDVQQDTAAPFHKNSPFTSFSSA